MNMTDEKTLQELRETAFKYAEAGWCVLPLANYQKDPSSFLGKWGKYKTQKPTKDELEHWFSSSRVTGVAVVCGSLSGVVVVDDDSYKTGNPLSLHSVLETKTASGGRHIFFQYTDQIGNRNVRTEAHEFEIQSDNKLIVLPPSRAKNKQGQIGQYQWAVGGLDELTKLSTLPNNFIEEYRQATYEKPSLESLVEAPLGTQHNNLRDLTHLMLSRFPRKDWDIASDVVRSLASKFDPPHPPERVERMIQDCINFRNKKGLVGLGDNFSTYTSEHALTNDFSLEGSANKRSLTVDFEPVLLGDITSEKQIVKWIWEGFIAQGFVTLLSALPKAGKTTLLVQMLQKIEAGGFLAGMEVHPTKVLVLTEEAESKWGERRDKFNLSKTDISIVSRPMNQKYSYQEWVAALARAAAICEEDEIKLCVIDTLTTFWNAKDENDAAKVNEALLPLNHLLKKGIGVLIIHHDRKSGGDNGTAARGSNALTGFVDVIVELNRLSDSPTPTRRVLKTLSRFDESPNEVVIDMVEGRYESLGDKSEVSKQQKLDNLANVIALLGKDVTVTDIFNDWDKEEFGRRPSRSTIQRHLAELVNLNRVKIVDKVLIGKTKTAVYRLNNVH